MNIKNKKTNNKGFTLVESLVTLITVTLVTGLFLTLVFFVKNTYQTLETNSEGQILSSTLTNYVQDELRYASFVETYGSSDSNGNYNFTYYSKKIGTGTDCKLMSYVDKDGDNKSKIYVFYNNDSEKHALIGSASYVFDLQASIDAKYNKNEEKFYVTIDVFNANNNSIITSQFVVDPLNESTLQ